MYKEIIISILLLILIIIGDVITQNYTKKTINDLTNELETLKQSLQDNSKEMAFCESKKIDEKWEQAHDKLAYYIEHDELEKVETNFTSCKSFMDNENYDFAINEIEKAVFVLNHITDKYSFNLVNIF